MLLNKLELFETEMKANGIEETTYTVSTGRALLTVDLDLADGDKIDMLLAIRGISRKTGKETTRIFAFQLARPYRTRWLEPEDYLDIIDLIMPMHESGSHGKKTTDDFEPFNLFSFLLDRHLPNHPAGGEQVRKDIDNLKKVVDANVAEADKVYFFRFYPHRRDGRNVTAKNLAKTRAHGTYEAYLHCLRHNKSSQWTSYPQLAKSITEEIHKDND